jgi:lambda family phage portal protein
MASRSKGHIAKDYASGGRSVKATYDAAQTTQNNQRRWQYTDSLSANEANSREVRHVLIRRSRYECSNNTYASGIRDTLAQDCVGTGARLQMMGNDYIHKRIEEDWRSWSHVVGLNKKLLVMRGAKVQDGEVFGLKVARKKQDHPVKLYLQLFESEQVQSHSTQTSKDPVDGVKLDEFGDPSEYRFLESHPGSLDGMSMKGSWVPASKVIHYAHTTRPGQIRGIPEITPALELFVQLRAYTLSVLSCAETAANISALMYTDAGVNDEADEVDPMLTWNIERGTLKAMPFGWKLAQLKAEQPTTTYPQFKEEIVTEIARCIHMPKNVVKGDSSGYNYASGRLDHTRYFKAIDVERSLLNEVVMENLFEDWIKEWATVKRIDLGQFDLRHAWRYDAQEHVDPVKTANAQKIRIANGTSNLSIEAAKEGRDWEDVMVQSLHEEKLEMELRQKLGLPAYDNKGDIIIIDEDEQDED